jgi:hypothetical protein
MSPPRSGVGEAADGLLLAAVMRRAGAPHEATRLSTKHAIPAVVRCPSFIDVGMALKPGSTTVSLPRRINRVGG